MATRRHPRRGRDQPRHRFRSRPTDPKRQAAGIVKRLQGARTRSNGTARNYLDRLADIDAVKREVGAWTQRRNACGSPAKWQFTTEDARVKLHGLYPSISY